jgi:alcohol dehydrogenase class IV
MIAQISLPRIFRIGGGASRELPQVLAMLGLSRPLIVTDAFLVGQGWVARIEDELKAAGMTCRVFADTVPDPTIASVDAGVAFLAAGDHDCVIGFGGGSPLDSAKAIAMLGVHGGAMADYKAPHVQDVAGLPVIAIPTTAGTGSDATRFTIVTDEITDEKMLCPGLAYLPVAALVDYELTLTKPRRLTADTGIDSLTHAIEAYVSKRANPFSDGMALLAMRAITPNLRRVCIDPEDRPAREAMMLGATQAGIAFSNSSVALVHGMSRPIGAHFHVPHGLSNAMLLPAVTAWSAPAALTRYADCARAMGVADEREGDQSAVARLLDELGALNRELDVPGPAAWGIDAARWDALVPTMCAQALASGSPANNPRVPDAAEIAELYARVWG